MFTLAATDESFMLAPSHYNCNEMVAQDRTYINYTKYEELTDRGVVYVTKMKKNLNHEVLVDCIHQNPQAFMAYREQVVAFRKDDINHIAKKFLNQPDADLKIMLEEAAESLPGRHEI